MTTSSASNTARLNFRLSAESKRTIEQAAALTGQTVSDFAVSVLLDAAWRAIQEHDQTCLSNRDRDAFISLLDETDAKPNPALKAAASRYKAQME